VQGTIQNVKAKCINFKKLFKIYLMFFFFSYASINNFISTYPKNYPLKLLALFKATQISVVVLRKIFICFGLALVLITIVVASSC